MHTDDGQDGRQEATCPSSRQDAESTGSTHALSLPPNHPSTHPLFAPKHPSTDPTHQPTHLLTHLSTYPPTHPSVSKHGPKRAYNVPSSVQTFDEAELSPEQQQNQLQIIKAKTMHEMVEELEGGARKILFLTNMQAELLAGSGAALERMLDALEIPRAGSGAPKLVINMLKSEGLSNQLNDHWRGDTETGPRVGRWRKKASFVNDDDERQAEQRLDSFMADVIIPLAARTNAIVMVNAFTCNCSLTQSFQRMVELQKMKWGGNPPFWVFAMTCEMHCLYGNQDPDSEWRRIKSQCRAWRLREPKIYDTLHADDPDWADSRFLHDCDPNASLMIIGDGIHTKGGKWDYRPFILLRTQLQRFLASSLPSVALQTGWFELDQGISLVQAKTPLLNIDLRQRKCVNSPGADRAHLIQE